MNGAGFSPTDTILGYAGLVWMGQLLAVLHAYGLYVALLVGATLWGLLQVLRGPCPHALLLSKRLRRSVRFWFFIEYLSICG